MLAKQPERPTALLVQKYIETIERNPQFSSEQRALSKLLAAFPVNQQLDDVIVKASAINSIYNTRIFAIYEVAHHIWTLKIDTLLESNSSEIVDRISRVTIGGKLRNNYSFATKYCSWHKPDAYPIYDSFVARVLLLYQRLDGFAHFTRMEELWNYSKFKETVEYFRTRYDLAGFGFRQIDNFMWAYGQELWPRKRVIDKSSQEL